MSGTWDQETAGKSVFVKFLAPWGGHCKSMKPAWDRLMDDFKGSPTSLIADVDCTESGKDLCEKHNVQGFPTIKYGDPDDLKDYEGGRDYDGLKQFAASSLGPQCGPGENIGLCSDKVKAKIEKYLKMSVSELSEKINKTIDKAKIDVPLMNKAKAYVAKVEAGGAGAASGKSEL